MKNFKLFLILILFFSCLKAKRSPADLQNSNPVNVITNLLVVRESLRLPETPRSPSVLTPPAAPEIKATPAPNSLTLSWAAATKNLQTDITYRVYKSLNPAFDTVAQVETGQALNEPTSGITSYTINNILSGSGDFYYNIIANDGTNKIAYTKLAYAIGDSTRMVFFAHANPVNGNLGGIAGANASCLATKNTNYTDLKCGGVRAFISVSTSNIKDANTENFFVANRPIFGIHNVTKVQTPLVNNWADFMLAGPISTSLGIVFGYSTAFYFYTFSDVNGVVNGALTCGNGTLTTGNAAGNDFGNINNWKNTSNAVNCNGTTGGSTYLLCLCY